MDVAMVGDMAEVIKGDKTTVVVVAKAIVPLLV